MLPFVPRNSEGPIPAWDLPYSTNRSACKLLETFRRLKACTRDGEEQQEVGGEFICEVVREDPVVLRDVRERDED